MCHKLDLEVQGNPPFLSFNGLMSCRSCLDNPEAIQSRSNPSAFCSSELGTSTPGKTGCFLPMGLNHGWLVQLMLLVSLANAGWPETINLAGMQRTLSQMSHGTSWHQR